MTRISARRGVVSDGLSAKRVDERTGRRAQAESKRDDEKTLRSLDASKQASTGLK
jgi:hypothetical protein